MKPKQKRTWLVNALGGIGYFTIALQWFWALIILGYPLFLQLSTSRPDTSSAPQMPTLELNLPTEVSIGITIIITVIMVVVAIISLILMPKALSSTTKKVTLTATDALIPVVTQHKKVSAKRRRILTYKMRLGLKVALWLIPFLAIYLAPRHTPLAFEIVTVIAWFLAGVTLLNFCLQYMLAYVLRIPRHTLN